LTSITDITAVERNAFREQILARITGIDDVREAYQAGDFERAAQLGIEFADSLRLMEDLGWGDQTPSQPVTLTMPPEQLHRVLTLLQADAERMRACEEQEEAEVRSETEVFRERAQRVTEACQRVLSAVGPGSA
jgi:hypothetical protein